MDITTDAPERSYINVMEILVAKETERQLERLPQRVLKYVKQIEVETFALNRLPALYASSEKGWEHQCEKAQHEYRDRITHAVRQALAAVQVDPIRLSKPLVVHRDGESQVILQTLRDMLQQPELSWDGVVRWIKQRLRGKSVAQPQSQGADHESTQHNHHDKAAWRPGTYGSNVTWRPKHNSSTPIYGWDDPHYRI
ncbi:MAG: late competence development ComFB family protein [Cyanobacteria bacterium J06639_16]